MSNKHTRKTFFAKVAAALAGLGLIGGTRAASQPTATASATSAAGSPVVTLQSDTRAVARTDASV